LLDTNIVVGLLSGHQPALDLLDHHKAVPSACAISQVTRMELLNSPSLSTDDDAAIRQAIAAFMVFTLDERTEAAAVLVRRRTKLKLPDAIILATAQVHKLELLTLDERLANAWLATSP